MDLLKEIHEIDNPRTEQDFIRENGLQKEIQHTCALLRKFFPTGEVRFELYTDHEYQTETLFVYVFSELSIAESSEILLAVLRELMSQFRNNPTFREKVSIVNRKKYA